MATVKQRLDKLEQSSGSGEMTHDDWVLQWLDKQPHPIDACSPEITDAEIDAFLGRTHNKPENHNANL